MSEILISLVDKSNPDDPAMCAQCHKRGDAIVIVPDGHQWTDRERTHPGWRILRLPLVSASAASVLLAPGRAAPGSGKLPTRHAFFLDVGGLPGDESGMDFAALDALKRPRPLPDDPRHIGDDARTIG